MIHNRLRPLLICLLLTVVALAGCTGGEDSGGDGGPSISAGKGAIAGLLVDDRFRPLQLTDDPTSEFQAEGFVLLQETGQQVQTNENGEFSFTDLDPGEYTLRASVTGHEAAPQKVQVDKGTFAEATLLARRVAGDAGFVISQEFAAFVSCGANAVVIGSSFDCTADQSGDSSRESFTANYTEVNATHLVMEMKSNSPQYYDVWLQPQASGFTSCGQTYQILGGPDTTYLRFQLRFGEQAVSSDTASGADCATLPWENDSPVQTVVYINSAGFEEGVGFGVGVYTGVQANFVQTVFVGEPDVDVDTFCVFCS